jgi:hypothetical protein
VLLCVTKVLLRTMDTVYYISKGKGVIEMTTGNSGGNSGANSGEWDDFVDPDAVKAAQYEGYVFGSPNGEGETPAQTLKRLFEENSAAAAVQIIKLSQHASTERIRFDACKYIVERVVGPTSLIKPVADAVEPGSLEHTLAEMERNIRGG